ncbi:uncharacterized protein LOC132061933 [Lycium ferocissimum]|uniref:uncharacterized protein LOC132061933 n=1 Tax=Lycium ferocissimum TaxID=112874 RepID=UPI0028154157|nr:uncharacterized protein LOC132061933 [Lycium ferocissimum]
MAFQRSLYSSMLITVCISMLTSPSLSLLFGGPDMIAKCFASVGDVPGCVEEIITSFLSIQLRLLGPQCCRAALDIDDGCWPNVFPFNPFFPPALKNFCSTTQAQLPPPSPQFP